jgi:hypothetical protein
MAINLSLRSATRLLIMLISRDVPALFPADAARENEAALKPGKRTLTTRQRSGKLGD